MADLPNEKELACCLLLTRNYIVVDVKVHSCAHSELAG